MIDGTDRHVTRWIDISPASIARDAYAPYDPGEIDGLFDWGEDPNGKAVHVAPYRGQLIVDIVEFDPNAVHQPHKPGDEIVIVLDGTLILTTDWNNEVLIVPRGEAVLIPVGWAGLYRVTAGEGGVFREFTIVPKDYFDGLTPPVNQGLPRLLPLSTLDGNEELFGNRYLVETRSALEAVSSTIEAAGDTIVQVLAGTMTLGDGATATEFAAGSAVVLPAGFSGSARYSAGYRSLVARWTEA